MTPTTPAFRWSHESWLALLLGSLVAAFSCTAPTPVTPSTYTEGIGDIIDAKCASCHHDGGIGPMPLQRYEDVVVWADVVAASVESGDMPPWPADKNCNSYANDFSLTDDERDALLRWLADGAKEGPGTRVSQVAADPRAVSLRGDTVLATGAYTPDDVDDYRCFAVAWPGEGRFITGYDFVSQHLENVHHANLFINPPGDGDVFLAYETRDDIPGYNCNLGTAVTYPQLIGSWAPGASGMNYPDDSGQWVEAGSVITMQVHYAGPGATDDAALVLDTAATVAKRGIGTPFWDFGTWDEGDMHIPAGAASVTYDVELHMGVQLSVLAPWFQSNTADIHIAALHMHELGRSGEISIHSPVGDTCLLDIPRWDFHRQMGFTLAQPVPVYLPEDRLFLRCTFDNSASHQVPIDGERPAPVDVNWGPSTKDEMCMGFLYATERTMTP